MKYKSSLLLLLGLLLNLSLSGCADTMIENSQKASKDIAVPGDGVIVESYWIAPERVPCQGGAPMQCLQVNKLEQEQLTQWQLFYDNIEGFDFTPGQFYKLDVAITRRSNPPADASGLHYKLLKSLEKTSQHFLPETMLIKNRQWYLKRLTDNPDLEPQALRRSPYITLSNDGLQGFSGCNRLFGQAKYIFEAAQHQNSMLKFGPVASTLMACHEPQANAIEQQMHQALSSANQFVVEWPFLNLYRDDKLLVQFVAADWD